MSDLKAGPADPAADADERVVEALPAQQPKAAPDPHSLGLELPEDKDEAVALLLETVATAQTEATSYLDDLKRVAADFENYRKRSQREHAAMLDRATEKVVQELMPVLDTFDAALATETMTDTERQLYSGMINTREQLLKALQTAGLVVIPTIGESFDPEIHEPVGAPGGNGELIVSQELRRGYVLNGKVLRAALVVLEVSE